MQDSIRKQLFDGLQALAECAFPKKCNCCGRIYQTADEFFQQTEDIPTAKTGLKATIEDDGSNILEVYRNCSCGSTLMDSFNDRRDLSERGDKRRKKFEFMLNFLGDQGIERKVAREELLKVMRGEKSILLSCIAPPKNHP